MKEKLNSLVEILGMVTDVANTIDNVTSVKGYDDLSTDLTVEPLFIVDNELLGLDWFSAVGEMATAAFTVQYCSAIPLLTANTYQLELMADLQKLNPTQTIGSTAAERRLKLMQEDKRSAGINTRLTVTPSDTKDLPKFTRELIIRKITAEEEAKKSGNYAVGIKTKPAVPEITTDVRVQISLRQVIEDGGVLVNALTAHASSSFIEDLFAYIDGADSLYELVFQERLYKKRKALLKASKNGTYQAIIAREAKATVKQLVSSDIQQHYGAATNIFCLSSRAVKRIEHELHGKLSKKSVRESLFRNNSLMMLIELNPDDEVVTVYYRNGSMSKMSKRQVVKSNGGENDLTKALKDIASGMAVRL